jgi:UDP-glucose/GDP-mannose dehydrogenase family, NAD binding domain.
LQPEGKLVLVVNKSTVPVGTADLVKKLIEQELAKRKVKA